MSRKVKQQSKEWQLAFQGEVAVMRVSEIPEGVLSKKVQPNNNQYIVAHSETGHHHVLQQVDNVEMYMQDNLTYFLEVYGETPVELKHLREFDTHQSLFLTPGKYQINHQQEYTPQGWRKVMD